MTYAEVIFAVEFTSSLGNSHQIQIWDMESPTLITTPTELTIEQPGYTLEYDAGITDIMVGGIITSQATIKVVNLNNVLDTFLTDLMVEKEGRYCIVILRNGVALWRGVLLADYSVRVIDEYQGIIQLTAVDGIGMLATLDTTNFDNTRRKPLLEYIYNSLTNIPTIETFESPPYQPFIQVKTDWFSTAMQAGVEPLNTTSAADNPSPANFLWETRKVREGYDGSDVTEIENIKQKDMIQHILTRFGAFLMMVNGMWTISQRPLLAETSTIQFHQWDKTYSYLGLSTAVTSYHIINQNSKYRADGVFEYLPALKQVKVLYLANFNTSTQLGSLLPNGYSVGDSPYTIFSLQQGTGNYLSIGIIFSQIWNCAGITGEFKMRPEYRLHVTTDNYILGQDGKTWLPNVLPDLGVPVVTSTAAERDSAGVLHNTTTAHYPNISGTWGQTHNTDDLPETSPVTIWLELVQWVAEPSQTNPIPVTIPPIPVLLKTLMSQFYCFYIVNNSTPFNNVEWIAKNTTPTDYSVECELEDSLFGSAGNGSKGLLHVWNGTQWMQSTGNYQFWNKGFLSPKVKYFNELLVEELLRGQALPILMFSGNIIERAGADSLLAYELLRITYKGQNYFMSINKVGYNPYVEEWAGDWLEVARKDVTISTNGTYAEINQWYEDNKHAIPIVSVTPVMDKVSSIDQLSRYIDYDNGDAIFNSLKVLDANGYPTNLYPYGKSIRFGFLYNWYAATDVREITSEIAWRVPSQTDFETLATYLGGSSVAGGKLKSTNAMYWDSPNTGATDEVNFGAVGSGIREALVGGQFVVLKNTNIIMGANEGTINPTITNMVVALTYDNNSIQTGVSTLKKQGNSIRLVRDASVAEQAYPDGTRLHDYAGNDGRLYQTTKIGTQVWTRENLVETKYRNGDAILNVQSAGDWIALSTGAYCYYDNDINNAWGNAPIAEVSVSPSSFRGAGTIDDPLDLANKADDALYSVRNGEFVQFNDTVDVILEWENWGSTLEQTISVVGLNATGTIMVAPDPTGNHTDNWAKFGIKAINGVDGEVTFICTDWPDEDINVIILILKFE